MADHEPVPPKDADPAEIALREAAPPKDADPAESAQLSAPGEQPARLESVWPTEPARVLSRDECMALVASAPYGRIVYTAGALPAVLPVMFVLAGGVLLFDVVAGSALADASRAGVLAFHADSVDVEGGHGWSVTMTGRAHHLPAPADRLAEDVRGPSAPARVTVALETELVSGLRAAIAVSRRVCPGASAG